MRETIPEQLWNRVVIQTLKLTRSGRSASLDMVASHARCSSSIAKRTLDSHGVNYDHGQVSISTRDRLRLALAASQGGFLNETARMLDWREFESFVEHCLIEAGYEARRNVRTRDKARIREVDVVAIKSRQVLCVDCKHWNTPSFPSKFNGALKHQLEATQMVLCNLSREENTDFSGLPIVLTLLEPREKLRNDVVLLSIGQLPSFLEELSEFAENLPFVVVEADTTENSIKGP